MSKCLDEWSLAAFTMGTLSAADAAHAEAHLASCLRCAKALAQLPVDDDLVERVRDLEHLRTEADPALTGLSEVQERVSTTVFGRNPGV